MNLIWHIIKKDIVRDRWALALWGLLFVGQVVVGGMALNPVELAEDHFLKLQLGSMGLVWLQMVMGFILVARLVQADVLLGTTAFWLTRPVSRARLLLAKGLGALLLFGLLPVLLLLPWWLHGGFGAREIIWSAVETFGWQLLMIGPAFLIASLTDDLGRLLLWTLLLVIGLLSWLALLQASFGSALSRTDAAGLGPGVMFTRLWLGAVVLVIGFGMIAAHQYLTRRFVRSVVLVAACLGLVAVTGHWWPGDLSGEIASWAEPSAAPASGLTEQLQLKVEPASGWRAVNSSKGRIATEDAVLQVLLRVEGLPGGLSVGVRSSAQTWVWPDGLKLERGGWFSEVQSSKPDFLRRHYSLPVPAADAETEQWRRDWRNKIDERLRARGDVANRMPSLPSERLGLLLNRNNIPNSFLAKMQAAPPAYRADLHAVLYRPEVLAELPVLHGSMARGGSESFRLRQAGKGEEVLIVTQPTLIQYGPWFAAGISDRFMGFRQRRSIMLVNKVTGDITEERGRGTLQMMVGGVAISWRKFFALKSPIVMRAGQEVAKDPLWRDHTILAVVVDREAGRFERSVGTEQFRVVASPDRP